MQAPSEPRELTQGTTWTWQRSLPDYPAPDWGLTYVFRGPVAFDLAASAQGADFFVKVTPAVTAAYLPGRYAWSAFVSDGEDRHVVGSGVLTVLPDPASMGVGLDLRTVAEKAVDALQEALLAWAANGGASEVEITGRRIRYESEEALRKALAHWQAKVRQEQTGRRGHLIGVRFGRA